MLAEQGWEIRLHFLSASTFFRGGIFFLVLLLCACSSQKVAPPAPRSKAMTSSVAVGAATGAIVGSVASGVPNALTAVMGGIVGGAVGLKLAEQISQDQLHHDLLRGNVQIIKVGEDIMVVLPSHSFFYDNSSHLNEAFYPVLDDVATFMARYQTVTVKVAGYTDNQGDNTRNLALSREQAQAIAKYIQHQGIDARYIYATGYGEDFPIALNDTLEGRYTNRRIQITFREIPKETA